MLVMKFGGTSVGSGERILRVAEIVLAELAHDPIVITSAMSGVTDALLTLADAAARGDEAACAAKLAGIAQRHLEAAQQIDPGGDWSYLDAQLAVLRADVHEALAARDGAPARRDHLAAWGERLAVVLVSRALERAGGHGWPWDAPLIVTDDHYGEATPDLARTSDLAHVALAAARAHGAILIGPGFIGQTAPDASSEIHSAMLPSPSADGEQGSRGATGQGSRRVPVEEGSRDTTGRRDGATGQGSRNTAGELGVGPRLGPAVGLITTLGRGGSDYAATLVAAALAAEACWIYTDVDGIFTADPRVVPEACVLPVIAYAAAGRLALCGAKVLHPRSVAPAVRAGCELRVKNTFKPEHEGTLLVTTSDATRGMPLAVAGRTRLAALTVCGDGLGEIPNLFARLCQAVATTGAEIALAAQPVPGHDPQVIVAADQAEAAVAQVAREFARERTQGQVHAVSVQADLALGTIVGDEMPATVLAATLRALASERITPLAQGAAPTALTFIIPAPALERALRRLHRDIILPALREVQQRHQRPYAAGQWAAGSRPTRRRRISSPEH
jgi:aspartokinase